MRVAVVGAGWAGLTAAVCATQAGHQVSLLEASHTLGGRARAQPLPLVDGSMALLDNGQHILIGAYRETLRLLQTVGVDTEQALLRMPLALQFPDGQGLRLPDWPAPLDTLTGIAMARGWSLIDKASLLRATLAWQRAGFRCAPECTVLQLCQGIRPRVLETLIEPLCVSALNTPPAQASAAVFLRVLQDALLGGRGASHLLLPRTDLGQLFPNAAAHWLRQHGAALHTGTLVQGLSQDGGWRLHCAASGSPGHNEGNGEGDGAERSPGAAAELHSENSSRRERHHDASQRLGAQRFDAVLWASSGAVAARLLSASAARLPDAVASAIQTWSRTTAALRYESIATVYLQADGAQLPQPMLALRSNAAQPAQFVFDRGQLGGAPGLLAFVVSASQDPRATLQHKVLQQARQQLGALLGTRPLRVLQTVLEKRATFACTPGLQRPPQAIAEGLWACGDYLAGPYPATLEGAVRSGQAAAHALALSPTADRLQVPLD